MRFSSLRSEAAVVEKLGAMRLGKAAEIVRDGVDETLEYMTFPREHWRCIRTNNPVVFHLSAERRNDALEGL